MSSLTKLVRAHALALAVMAPLSAPALARDTVVGLSPNQDASVLKGQLEATIQHLLQTMEAGETAHFVDASNLRLIGTFVVPEGSAYESPRARLNANPQLLARVRAFLGTAKPNPANPGLIDFPGLLGFVGENFPTEDGADLIVFGSWMYQNALAPRLEMRDGRVPEDGYVSAFVAASPLGTHGLSGSLKGYDVYFGLTGENWVSQRHAYYVERLWAISVDGHGGSLQFFDDDVAALLLKAGRDAPDRSHPVPLVPTGKLDIIRFHAADTGELPGYFTAPPEQEPAPEPIWRSARNVSIALRWGDRTIDLDLFVVPTVGASLA